MKMDKSAIFSGDLLYRYSLSRHWDWGRPACVFICLNPSTADAENDDPTVRRCIRYSQSWGYGGLVMLNIFGYRSTDPKALKLVDDPVGPGNDDWIQRSCYLAPRIVVAWGTHGAYLERGDEVRQLLGRYTLHHLGLTKDGHPRHPLYLRKDLKPIRWEA